MPVYLIVEQTISGPQDSRDYVSKVVPTIFAIGGKLLSYTSR